MQFTLPLPPGFEDRIAAGDLVVVAGPNGDAAGPELADDPEPDMDPLPGRGEPRRVWEAFALTQGMDRDEVRKMTKAQLVGKLVHRAEV
jgi:hypothetical protein